MTGIDLDILSAWQHAYQRLEYARLFDVVEPKMYEAFDTALESLLDFDDVRLAGLGREAQSGVYAAREELNKISINVCGDLFPLTSKRVH